MTAPKTFAAIGSSHLFGLIQQFVGPMLPGQYQFVWDTGVPATGALDIGAPGWEGRFVLYNTPAGGPPPQVKDGVLYMPPQLSTILASIDPGVDVIFSLMRGQEFAMASLVDDPTHADFNGDDSLCEPGRQWVSRADATDWVRQISAPLLGTHVALKHHFPRARIVHVPAPPPVESESHIRDNAESFGPLFARHGIKPFAMRRRLYQLMYGDLNQSLAGYGIASLPLPAAALTPAGGLKAEYARGCLHGNEQYAREMALDMKRSLADAPV